MAQDDSPLAMSAAGDLKHAHELVRAGKVDLLSVDIFDTLLLRTTKPETFRFWQMASRKIAVLSAADRGELTCEDLFAARLMAVRAAYRNAPRREGSQETRLDEILRLKTSLLNLPADCIEPLFEAEIAYEKTELRANRRLCALLQEAHERGVRLVYASDMYLPSAAIDTLLEHAGVTLPFTGRYSSADSGLSKRSGALFRLIERAHDTAGAACLHVGDDYRADVARPAEIGWRTAHTPRGAGWRTIAGLRRRQFDLALRRRGLVV